MSLLDQQNPFFAHPHLTGSLWPEPVRDSFKDRVAALAEVGATGMGMGTYELEALPAGETPETLRTIADDHGIRIGELELLLGWHTDGDEYRQARQTEDRMYAAAEVFGVQRIKTSAVFIPPAPLAPLDLLVERFAALCDRAAAHGLTVELEPFAVFPAFNYDVAADVVVAADRPNGGLLIDAWHYFRDPHGPAGLAKVDGRHITGFELADGHAQPVGSVQDDCIHHRLLPGEGDFDLVTLTRTLADKGVDVPVSVEVISVELRELTPQQNAERTVAAVRKILSEARSAGHE